jgi:hypothetical protein
MPIVQKLTVAGRGSDYMLVDDGNPLLGILPEQLLAVSLEILAVSAEPV